MGLFEWKTPAWDELSEIISGETHRPGFPHGPYFSHQHREWEIRIDHIDSRKGGSLYGTAVRALFASTSDFQFNVRPRTLFTFLRNLIHGKDFTTGDPDFDEQLVTRTNATREIGRLPAKAEIRQGLLELMPYGNQWRFEIRKDEGLMFPLPENGTSLLFFRSESVIEDVSALLEICVIFCETLDLLVTLDLATEDKAEGELLMP